MPNYLVKYSLVDSMGRPGTKTLETQVLVDQAAALTAAASMAILLDDVTEMRIKSYTVSERIVYTDTFEAGANRDEGASITVEKADNYNAPHNIPAPVQAMRLPDGTVDLTNAALIAYFAEFEATGDFQLSDGEVITSVVRGTIDV